MLNLVDCRIKDGLYITTKYDDPKQLEIDQQVLQKFFDESGVNIKVEKLIRNSVLGDCLGFNQREYDEAMQRQKDAANKMASSVANALTLKDLATLTTMNLARISAVWHQFISRLSKPLLEKLPRWCQDTTIMYKFVRANDAFILVPECKGLEYELTEAQFLFILKKLLRAQCLQRDELGKQWALLDILNNVTDGWKEKDDCFVSAYSCSSNQEAEPLARLIEERISSEFDLTGVYEGITFFQNENGNWQLSILKNQCEQEIREKNEVSVIRMEEPEATFPEKDVEEEDKIKSEKIDVTAVLKMRKMGLQHVAELLQSYGKGVSFKEINGVLSAQERYPWDKIFKLVPILAKSSSISYEINTIGEEFIINAMMPRIGSTDTATLSAMKFAQLVDYLEINPQKFHNPLSSPLEFIETVGECIEFNNFKDNGDSYSFSPMLKYEEGSAITHFVSKFNKRYKEDEVKKVLPAHLWEKQGKIYIRKAIIDEIFQVLGKKGKL